jgi:hypothetical protein
MTDVIYRDGFPSGWFMTHRPDATLLVRQGDGGLTFDTVICAAPRLQQGEAWLQTAIHIAVGYDGLSKEWLARRHAAFCDRCGYGPSTDEDGNDREHTRAEKPWFCLDCGHHNQRPAPANGRAEE